MKPFLKRWKEGLGKKKKLSLRRMSPFFFVPRKQKEEKNLGFFFSRLERKKFRYLNFLFFVGGGGKGQHIRQIIRGSAHVQKLQTYVCHQDLIAL